MKSCQSSCPHHYIDKSKTLLQQHPDLDIRMLFQRASNKLSKKSKTSYADWCDKHGVVWAEGDTIPAAWLAEKSASASASTTSSK